MEKAKAAVEPTKKNNNAGAAATEDDEEDICAICQYPLSDEPSTKMPCSHVYHVACVEKLRSYDIKQVCPTCRVDLPPGPEQVYEEGVRQFWILHRRYYQGDDKPWRRIRNADDRREAAEVVRMMTEAGEQGHAQAQYHLGVMYEQGKGGLPQSDALAVEWYRKAADQGDAGGQVGLARMYHFGLGDVPQDSSMALTLLQKAAAQGNKNAAARIPQVLQALQAQRRQQQQASAPSSSATRTASPSPSAPMPIGTRVELHGLKAKKLNRQRGEVVGFVASSGRCEVKLDDGRGPYSLKAENLKKMK